jgi:hypothetical protein
MPCKRQFGLDREDSDFLSFPSFSGSITRENKSGFRQIHLPRQGLHLGVIQSASIGKNRQWIARERRMRENINLSEFVSSARDRTSSICSKTWKTERTFVWLIKKLEQNS